MTVRITQAQKADEQIIRDVWSWMADIEENSPYRVRLALYRGHQRGVVSIEASIWCRDEEGGNRRVSGHSSQFPSNSYSTLAGALFNVVSALVAHMYTDMAEQSVTP